MKWDTRYIVHLEGAEVKFHYEEYAGDRTNENRIKAETVALALYPEATIQYVETMQVRTIGKRKKVS